MAGVGAPHHLGDGVAVNHRSGGAVGAGWLPNAGWSPRGVPAPECLPVEELGPAARFAGRAALIASAAYTRTESRGAHHRTDHPDPDPAWAGVRLRLARN